MLETLAGINMDLRRGIEKLIVDCEEPAGLVGVPGLPIPEFVANYKLK